MVTTSSPLATPSQDLDVAVAAAAELDRARLEAALALGDQHDLARAAVDDGARRHRRSPAPHRRRPGTPRRHTCRPCKRPSGLGISMRTRAVRVSALSSG